MRMKMTKLPVMLLAVLTIGFASCSDDDNYVPDDVVTKAFSSKYPDATNVKWETKTDYKVADFVLNNKECEAWFDAQGNWKMTETDILFSDLPLAVQESFTKSVYSACSIDDVDKIERPDMETVYVIEVEKGEVEVDLYYVADGTLIKEVTEGTGSSHYPTEILAAITDFITEKYAGAKIIEYDKEANGVEVDIVHNGIYKDVYFTTSGEWVRTEWDIPVAQVPELIMAAVKASSYGSYTIDEVEIHETPDGVFYVFELESGNKEVLLTVKDDGTIV